MTNSFSDEFIFSISEEFGEERTSKIIQDLDLIKTQSDCLDNEFIKNSYYECNHDITDTIIKLLNISIKKPESKELNTAEKLREIMDSKEAVYHIK